MGQIGTGAVSVVLTIKHEEGISHICKNVAGYAKHFFRIHFKAFRLCDKVSLGFVGGVELQLNWLIFLVSDSTLAGLSTALFSVSLYFYPKMHLRTTRKIRIVMTALVIIKRFHKLYYIIHTVRFWIGQ